MASRRPSTANDVGSSRMPFATAEALLWGPEMKTQHAYLLTEMRALQNQQEAYDVRIRATEAVAETAKAATAQVRHLEQQLAAIEAQDDNKAFEKWASGEITRLGIIVDTNANARQSEVELRAHVVRMSDNLDTLLRKSMDLEGALRRIDLLEHSRREDTKRIQSLETEVDRLKSMQQSDACCPVPSRLEPKRRRDITRKSTLSQRLDPDVSDATTETDSEEMLLPWTYPREEIQVPQSPDMRDANSSNALVTTSPTKSHSIISARRRLLQRPSIYDPKLPQLMEEQNAQPGLAEKPHLDLHRASPPPTQIVVRQHPHNEPVPAPTPQIKADGLAKTETSKSAAPATQLVERKPPRKRKQPDLGSQTQRQTRSQARRNQAKEVEVQAVTGAVVVPEIQTQTAQKTEPVSPPRKKLKGASVSQRARNEIRSGEASQAAGRDTGKTQNQCKVEEQGAQNLTASAKSVSTTKRKRKTKTTASLKKKRTPAPPPVSRSPEIQETLIVKLPIPRKPGYVSLNFPEPGSPKTSQRSA